MLKVTLIIIVMLSVVMPSVVMLSVVAPYENVGIFQSKSLLSTKNVIPTTSLVYESKLDQSCFYITQG